MGIMEASISEQFGLKPTKYDRGGALYSESDINMALVHCIDTSIRKKERSMSKQINNATSSVDTATKKYLLSHKNMKDAVCVLEEGVKLSSQSIRKSCNGLSQSLDKIERDFDFNKMERMASTFERISEALESLSKLQSSGQLDKVVSALKES